MKNTFTHNKARWKVGLRTSFRSTSLTVIGAVLFASISGGDVRAQSEPDGFEHVLEEVRVTARRRSELLQEVPLQISVFSALDIERAGIDRIDKAIALTPNFEIRNDQQPGVFTMTVRGVSQNRNAEAPIAFVVDGVPVGNVNAFTQDLYDIERIEILKGPQGALYGRNAIGGAINVVTKAPTNEYEGQAELRYGKDDYYRFGGSYSGPIVEDRLLFRVSGFYEEGDGLIYNVTRDAPAEKFDNRGIRGKLLFNATDNVTFDLRASYGKIETGAALYTPTTVNPVFMNSIQPNVIIDDFDSQAVREIKDVYLKVDWETKYGTLTSITGYDDLFETLDQTFDWLEISLVEGVLTDDIENVTQELRWVSPYEDRFGYIIGAFYQDTKKFRGIEPRLNLNCVVPPFDCSPANKFLIPVNVSFVEQNSDVFAVFGQVEYDISEKLTVLGSLRYDEDQRSVTRITAGFDDDASFSLLQPKVSLAYDWNDRVMTYISAARGFRSGGFNDTGTFGFEYDQEELWTYELGFKSTSESQRIRLNGAIFYTDYDDQQFFLIDNMNAQALVNGDKSTVKGFELDTQIWPLSNWQISAGFGYTDGEIDRIPEFTGAPPFIDFDELSGNTLPFTSEWKLNFSTEYTHNLQNGVNLIARFDYVHYGETWFTLDNIERQEPYGLAALRIGAEFDRWTVTAYAENLFDNRDWTNSMFTSRWIATPTNLEAPSTPRNWGITARFIF